MNIPVIGQVLNLVSTGFKSLLSHKSTKIQAELKKRGMELEEKKMEAMLEVMEIEFKQYVLENSLQIDSDFREFVVEYEGAAKDVHPAVQFMRAIIRPLITIWAVLIITYLMFATDPNTITSIKANMEAIPEKLWDIFFAVFAFWFGGRAVQHIIDKYAQGKVQEKKHEAEGDIEVAAHQTEQERIRAGVDPENSPRTHFTEKEITEAMPRARKRRRFGPRR